MTTPDPLPQRLLFGTTGVSLIGLGTVKLGRTAGLKYPAHQLRTELPTDEQALALLTQARQLGINLIDTAPAYGVAEERLGALLPRVAPRDQWVIVTKVGEELVTDSSGKVQSRYDFQPSAIRQSVERSLLRLRTDTLDVVLLHFASTSPDAGVLRTGEAIGELRRLQAEGKLKAVGASTGTAEGGLLAAELCDVVMLTYNSTDQRDGPAITKAGQRGAGVLIKKPLASGSLDTPTARADSLRLIASRPGVTAAIVGTASPSNLLEACRAVAIV